VGAFDPVQLLVKGGVLRGREDQVFFDDAIGTDEAGKAGVDG
jgi:hypothetical protein